MPVAFLPAARQDMLRQYAHLLREAGPSVANRFVDSVEATAQRLARHPSIGIGVRGVPKHLNGVRLVRTDGFELLGLYYIVGKTGPVVIRVLHARRDVPAVLRTVRARR